MVIKNLEELKDRLSKEFNGKFINKEKIKELLKDYSGTDWEKYIKFDEVNYVRNSVYKTKSFDVLILCWNKNQKSPVHKHPKDGCFVKILDGELFETRYFSDGSSKNSVFKNGDVTYIDNDIATHDMKTKLKTVSLHVYSPGFYNPRDYLI